LPQTAEEPTSRPPGEMPEITRTVMPLSRRDGEVTALDEQRANTDIEHDSWDNEPDDEYFRSKTQRAKSLDSARRTFNDNTPEYTSPANKGNVAETGVSFLTAEQEEQIVHDNALQDEGITPEIPRNKGKTIDPRNWGDVDFEPDELNVNKQEEMFESYGKAQLEKRRTGEHSKTNKKHRNEKLYSKREDLDAPVKLRDRGVPSVRQGQNPEIHRAGSKPAAHIVPESSLGVALGNVARLIEGSEGPDDPSSSSSESEGGHSRSTRSYSSSRSRRRHRRRGSKRSSRKKSRRGSKKSRSSNSIKPIPPKDYGGAADSRAYHRFVLEGEAYLRDGKVPRARHIRILAYYLEGKAYNFYMQKVASDDPNNWDLHKFFTELFNYCFPVDYRQRMRLKLEDFYQRQNQSVSEFVFELQELFSMVGAMPEEMKVIKLWHSLSTRIQKALWRDGLHPDSST
jgi:hypothetical protein